MSTILTLLFTAALAAQPVDPPPPKQTVPSAPKARDAKVNTAAPDPELIGFLGDYEDAADGLDPIGLSEQVADDKTAAATSDKKKGEHQP